MTFAVIQASQLYNTAAQTFILQPLVALPRTQSTYPVDEPKRRKRARLIEPVQQQLLAANKPAKQVRFNELVEFTPSPSTNTSKDWISEKQLRLINNINRALASEHKKSADQYTEAIAFLMSTHKHHENKYHRQTLAQHVRTIMQKDCRGLERAVAPEVSKARRRAVKVVLDLQRKLRKDGLKGTALAHDILADKSRSSSQPLRQLAFRLAQADEYEARLVQKEE